MQAFSVPSHWTCTVINAREADNRAKLIEFRLASFSRSKFTTHAFTPIVWRCWSHTIRCKDEPVPTFHSACYGAE